MKKYLVSITEINYGNVAVEANSIEDVRRIADEAYHKGMAFFNKGDLEVGEITPIE